MSTGAVWRNATARELQQAFDHLPAALRLFFDRGEDLLVARVAASAQELGVAQDDADRVVQLVGDARGHAGQAHQTFGLQQLLLMFLHGAGHLVESAGEQPQLVFALDRDLRVQIASAHACRRGGEARDRARDRSVDVDADEHCGHERDQMGDDREQNRAVLGRPDVLVQVLHRGLGPSSEDVRLVLGRHRELQDPFVTSRDGGAVARADGRQDLGVEEPFDFLAGFDDSVHLRRAFGAPLRSDRGDEVVEVLGRLSKQRHVGFVPDDDRVRDVRVLVADGAGQADDVPDLVLLLLERVEAMVDVEEGPQARHGHHADEQQHRAEREREPPRDALTIELRNAAGLGTARII